ncbi:aldolase/citrate lyase family protein [Streptomyces sp. NPDC093544]|uniref:HpcH/HpaI aldolase family protein n=1 Tax=Streptomyces sp. NPDC093544 TaxID=3155200 RepID=UPI0034463860
MNTLVRAWSEGVTTLGAWTTLNTPVVAERLALVGHDYVCLDQQHGIADDGSLVSSLIAVAAGGAAPLVRIAANEPSMIGKALDCGAEGVIIPLVNDRRDAERAVQSCRYPPNGERSVGPIRSAGSGRGRENSRAACIVMAESAAAVKNIDEICSVPGVDGVYIGPADLAASLGGAPSLGVVPGVHAEAIAKIIAACSQHGVATGIHCGTTRQAIECAEMGFQMITISTDTQLLATAATSRFDEVNKGIAAAGVRSTTVSNS